MIIKVSKFYNIYICHLYEYRYRNQKAEKIEKFENNK